MHWKNYFKVRRNIFKNNSKYSISITYEATLVDPRRFGPGDADINNGPIKQQGHFPRLRKMPLFLKIEIQFILRLAVAGNVAAWRGPPTTFTSPAARATTAKTAEQQAA